MTGRDGPSERESSLFPLVVGITLLSLASFGLAAAGSPIRRTRYTPLVSLHGALMTAWLVLLCVQARLADRGDLAIHRRLGRTSGVLVAAFVPLSAWVAFNFHQESGRTATLVADLGLLVTFVPLYLMAVRSAARGRIDVHKRLMLVATIALVSPALARLTDVLGLPRPAAVPLYLALLFGAPAVYDLRSRGRPHAASVASALYALLPLAAALVVTGVTGRS